MEHLAFVGWIIRPLTGGNVSMRADSIHIFVDSAD